MDRPPLTLVPRYGDAVATGSRSPLVGTWAAALMLLALWATARGADEARAALPARQVAGEALQASLELGSHAPAVREALARIRGDLGRRPLGSATRARYAELLLALSRSVADTRAAAFHAALAARLAPVTVPVVRRAAIVLARTPQSDVAVSLVRDMFGYDAKAAAEVLDRIAFTLPATKIDEALGDDPRACLAWADRLRTHGRVEEGDRWLSRCHERWPRDLPVLRQTALARLRAGDPAGFDGLFPDDLVIPARREHAELLTYRARARGAAGRRAEALGDVEAALEAGGRDSRVTMLAGDACLALGDADRARGLWNRVLNGLGPRAAVTRAAVLARLARLEERQGQPGTALRLWRSVLEVDPQHEEALSRVRGLTEPRTSPVP